MKIRLSVLITMILVVTSVALADDRIIPRGSKIYIDEIPENVGMYLKAEIVKKKIPIQIVTKQEDADYLLQGIAEGSEDRKWHEGWLTVEKDHTTHQGVRITSPDVGMVRSYCNLENPRDQHGQQYASFDRQAIC